MSAQYSTDATLVIWSYPELSGLAMGSRLRERAVARTGAVHRRQEKQNIGLAQEPGRETPGLPAAGAAGVRPWEGSLVSDTTEFLTSSPDRASTDAASTGRAGKTGGGLAAMRLPELQQLAQSMGIKGTGRLRKGEVIAAIQEKQGGGGGAARAP